MDSDDLVNGRKRSDVPPVIVLYNDCQQQYSPDSPMFRAYRLSRASLLIIIDPISCEGAHLYRVRTYVDPTNSGAAASMTGGQQHSGVGPLQNGMVVSGRVLPLLVRQTAISACRAVAAADRAADLAKLGGGGGGGAGGRGVGGAVGQGGASGPAASVAVGNGLTMEAVARSAPPLVRRQRIIQKIYDAHVCDVPSAHFLGLMFRDVNDEGQGQVRQRKKHLRGPSAYPSGTAATTAMGGKL